MKPELVYHGKQYRSSLFWLLMTLFLGGCPLGAYFSSPEPEFSEVMMAAFLGGPAFVLSLKELGESRGLLLDHQRRQLKDVEWLYSWSNTAVYSYAEVRGLHLIHGRSYSHGQGKDAWFLIISLVGDREIVLEEGSYEKALRCAVALERALGIQTSITPEWVPPPGHFSDSDSGVI